MSAQPKQLLTAEEYLALERVSPTKHEFYRGEMFAMAGAGRIHNLIALNIASSLHEQFRNGPCETYVSDMRVHIPTTGLYTYPDIVVTCQQPQFEDGQLDTLLNPLAIFEVVSDSTEAYDRGRKFKHYMAIDSLRHYLLVAQHDASIDHFTRDERGNWSIRSVSGLDVELTIATIGCTLRLANVYARVKFPPESAIGPPADLPGNDIPR